MNQTDFFFPSLPTLRFLGTRIAPFPAGLEGPKHPGAAADLVTEQGGLTAPKAYKISATSPKWGRWAGTVVG